MADNVFEPKTGTEFNVTLGGTETNDIILDVLFKLPCKIISPRVAQLASKIKRKWSVRYGTAHEVWKSGRFRPRPFLEVRGLDCTPVKELSEHRVNSSREEQFRKTANVRDLSGHTSRVFRPKRRRANCCYA